MWGERFMTKEHLNYTPTDKSPKNTSQEYRAIQARNTELYKPGIQSYTSQEYRAIQARNTELYKPGIQSYTSQEYRVIQARNTELTSTAM